jgi:N6-L-threonylcarbamoyladenine synthase
MTPWRFRGPKFTHRDRKGVPADVVHRTRTGRPMAEFSFSGLKTAVMRALQERGVAVAQGLTVPTDAGPMSEQDVDDFCASFQRVVVESLVDRTFDAAKQLGAKSVGIAGGCVRQQPAPPRRGGTWARPEGMPGVRAAAARSRPDNAAMIAAAGPAQDRARRHLSARLQRARNARHRLAMRVHTDYLWFETKQRQEFIRITDDVARSWTASGVQEGMVWCRRCTSPRRCT